MKKTNLPHFLKPVLYSYDMEKLDKSKDQRIIIGQILNIGTKEMTDWLFENYSKKAIKDFIKKEKVSRWNKKSLSY